MDPFVTRTQSSLSGGNNGDFGSKNGTLELEYSNSRNQFAANSSVDGDGGSSGGGSYANSTCELSYFKSWICIQSLTNI